MKNVKDPRSRALGLYWLSIYWTKMDSATGLANGDTSKKNDNFTPSQKTCAVFYIQFR